LLLLLLLRMCLLLRLQMFGSRRCRRMMTRHLIGLAYGAKVYCRVQTLPLEFSPSICGLCTHVKIAPEVVVVERGLDDEHSFWNSVGTTKSDDVLVSDVR
jgi:hypothetical protein